MGVRSYRRSLGPRFSEGARLLWVELERRGESMRDLRRRIGVGADITRWLYGDAIPPLAAIVRMDKLFGIPARAWLQPAKRAFIPPAARASRTGTDG